METSEQSSGPSCPDCSREFSSEQAVSLHQSNGCYPELGNREWLVKAYVHEQKSIREIADELDCSRHPVQEAINRFDIESRDTSEAMKLATEKGVAPAEPAPREIWDEEWLREHYISKEWSGVKISRVLGCSDTTVYDALRRYGIQIRTWSEAHPGESVEEYGKGWNETKRRKVRERDNNTCQVCGMTNEEHVEQIEKSLHVHHIRKARLFDNPEPRNSMSNLITLCIYCHRQADRFSPLLPAPSN